MTKPEDEDIEKKDETNEPEGQSGEPEQAADAEPQDSQPEASDDSTTEAGSKDQKESPGRASKNAKGDDKDDESEAVDKEEGDGFVEQVISIKRITKVTKGGKKLSFSALVVVGDTKGNVGYSLSKASEVATAIRKALNTAKKKMISVPMRGTTIAHEIIGECGGARVLLKPASEGTGVIAAGPVRAVCDGAGIHNILTKCHRSNNPINVVKATMNGLERLKTVGSQG